MLWLLDTDHMTHWQRHHPMVLRRLGQCQQNEYGTTIVTLEEQLRGRLAQLNQRNIATDRIRFHYASLQSTYDFYQRLQVFEFSYAAELQYADLLKQQVRVGTQDLRIAAIALSLGATVVTCNSRDFGRVPGLSIEDWTVP
jgi:tRNA(fMet)-specific endonuclease VapC